MTNAFYILNCSIIVYATSVSNIVDEDIVTSLESMVQLWKLEVHI